jgi:hypothetical protein
MSIYLAKGNMLLTHCVTVGKNYKKQPDWLKSTAIFKGSAPRTRQGMPRIAERSSGR